MMGPRLATLVLGSTLTLGSWVACAQAAPGDDALVAQFFAIWDVNGRVTPEAVESHYADRVFYYGRSLTNAEVLADKRAFVRRWPERQYRPVPGTVEKGCDPTHTRCTLGATLAWHAASPARGAVAGGYTRVSLDLVRQGGDWRIVRETGRPVREPDDR